MDYSYSFESNIPYDTFNSTSRNVLSWIEENRDKFDWAKDPNAYEMVNLFLFGSKYSQEGKEVDTETLTRMWNIRSKDFEGCNIGTNHFVYTICQDSYNSAISGNAMVNDENSHHALRKMAGLGLYLKQQQRDNGEISYNNSQELLQLLQCSSSLKTFHPELFERYAFTENIKALCKLQLQNELPSEIAQFINEAQDEIFNKTTDHSVEVDKKDDDIELD